MTDDLEADELEETKAGAKSGQTFANWRPKIGKRLVDRLRLLAAWLRITILPQFGRRILFSIILTTSGRLADAASFVVGIHILTHSLSDSQLDPTAIQEGLIWAAIGLAGVLAVGSGLGYLGNRLAAKVVLEYEMTCVVDSLSIVRHYQDNNAALPQGEIANITKQAPRVMSRSLLNVMNASTACVLTVAGLATCAKLFPALTIIVLLSLVLLSPFYIYAAVHSTNIGHRIRIYAPGYGITMKRLQSRWLSKKQSFDEGKILQEVRGDPDYRHYFEAYRERMTLSARNHFLSSITLAFVIAVSFLWIANDVELNPKSIATVVSYLVALRLFSHGLAGIFHGIQGVNSTLPLYLTFLLRDPRINKVA
ncbi:ABC transporter ATP-binding protein [Microvirga makkahensis]|uniref:Uncharacterized protein n=1 Tax=Microvirga makkahensis TaxID=1128670 RepID=A0A7X3MTI8_9HYPH|nr:ABC transporter ATP-binding protein [Microvirga makkahensis]MXQ12886.1 hypothetical protein [Microvirga makkahensis]